MSERPHRHLAILHQATGSSVSGDGSAAADGTTGQRPALETCADDVVLQVGELAKLANKTVRAIHLYEDLGLLRPVERSPGRYRLYNADSLERVRWITKMQAVGFSLPELKQLLNEQAQARTGKEAAIVLRGAYVEKLADVQGKLTELHRLEQELLSSLTYLDACQSACADDAHRESCPECERHGDQPAAPSLVAGAHVH